MVGVEMTAAVSKQIQRVSPRRRTSPSRRSPRKTTAPAVRGGGVPCSPERRDILKDSNKSHNSKPESSGCDVETIKSANVLKVALDGGLSSAGHTPETPQTPGNDHYEPGKQEHQETTPCQTTVPESAPSAITAVTATAAATTAAPATEDPVAAQEQCHTRVPVQAPASQNVQAPPPDVAHSQTATVAPMSAIMTPVTPAVIPSAVQNLSAVIGLPHALAMNPVKHALQANMDLSKPLLMGCRVPSQGVGPHMTPEPSMAPVVVPEGGYETPDSSSEDEMMVDRVDESMGDDTDHLSSFTGVSWRWHWLQMQLWELRRQRMSCEQALAAKEKEKAKLVPTATELREGTQEEECVRSLPVRRVPKNRKVVSTKHFVANAEASKKDRVQYLLHGTEDHPVVAYSEAVNSVRLVTRLSKRQAAQQAAAEKAKLSKKAAKASTTKVVGKNIKSPKASGSGAAKAVSSGSGNGKRVKGVKGQQRKKEKVVKVVKKPALKEKQEKKIKNKATVVVSASTPTQASAAASVSASGSGAIALPSPLMDSSKMPFSPKVRKRREQYEPEQLYIPKAMLSRNVTIPVIVHKEIYTPQWKVRDRTSDDAAARTASPMEVSPRADGNSSDEDTSDEAYLRRHFKLEVEEMKKQISKARLKKIEQSGECAHLFLDDPAATTELSLEVLRSPVSVQPLASPAFRDRTGGERVLNMDSPTALKLDNASIAGGSPIPTMSTPGAEGKYPRRGGGARGARGRRGRGGNSILRRRTGGGSTLHIATVNMRERSNTASPKSARATTPAHGSLTTPPPATTGDNNIVASTTRSTPSRTLRCA
eukprot:GFYU01002733.1.p1 GENE.GFYU01002733.1~~GFYU01002733.1.p1  ORF type:complete len:821 (-),score=179.08 GFYU01002733.1:144-2606(-)